MKNLLGIIRSLANQTDVEGRSAKELRDAFLGRLQTVSEAETLGLAGGTETDLSVLVEQSLKVASPEQCRLVAGPAVRLRPRQVVPMSLILHELVTNAFKYGALSKPGGLIHLSWRTSDDQGKSLLHIDWREENGPPVTQPTRSGFGSKLIELSATQDLRGSVELKYEPAGLRVYITAPVEA
ncbi:two-component sensor histidine kinase [Bradyrhizobium sp. R2.2-H]|jgi:two-component sensor histidine kinase|uniref:sensor histidine kinase n=1 Tax=unclassified Bradyrhizobium TaxID=2631580 RepID=UPI0010EB489D|nr:two-component sensor histidine kinase [Bradyrhizobium sp. Y-H1]TCU67741.1 two-component sensor histidine kinase [Bradyrhizobium sp. R2.2-H]